MVSETTQNLNVACGTHQRHRLNCQQYDGLLGESQGLCQICGFPAELMPQRKLYIDHEHYFSGQFMAWTVRGLVCVSCNKRLGDRRPFNRGARAYLDESWFLRQCALSGMPVIGRLEPEAGRLVDNFGFRWTRDAHGLWHSSHERSRRANWDRLLWVTGPFNLREYSPLEHETSF